MMTKKLTERSEPSDQLTLRNFSLRAESINEQDRSVEAVIATDTPVVVMDMARWEPIEEVLLMSGVILPASRQVPMLDNHDRSSVRSILGSTRDIRIEGGNLVGRNVFSKKQAADDAWQLIREGHLKDNSIGYRVLKYDQIAPGKSKTIQGRSYTAGARPLRVTTAWEVRENSICPIGADELAKVRSRTEPDYKPHIKELNSMKFEEWLKKRGLALSDLTEAQAKALRDDFDAEVQRQAIADANQNKTQDPDELLEQGRKAELKRREEIKRLGKHLPDELIERAISENWTIDTAKDKFLEAMRTTITIGTGSPAIHTRTADINSKTLEVAMLLRANMIADPVKEYGVRDDVAELGYKLRDMPLHDLCREAIRLDGLVVPVGREEMMQRAFSTASLPQILGNIANKAMLKGYTAMPKTWESWCSIGSVSDFKENTRVRLTDVGTLELVANGGEVKHGSATEEYEKFTIATYAKQFSITRTNIINDDAGAFTRVPQKMGIKAAQKIDSLVYAHLLANGNMSDSAALFVSGHGNLNTSNGLTVADALGTAIKAFRNQKDADGEPIDIEPKYLIVPPSLETIARKLMESELIMATDGTSSTKQHPMKNVYRGMMQVIVEPRLENTNYTGYSATSWYVAADPATCDTIEVAFLNGKSTPTVEKFDTSPSTMGVIYRVYIDAGVKALDYRGLQKNTA